jgi:hypothetical protein
MGDDEEELLLVEDILAFPLQMNTHCMYGGFSR